MLDYWYIIVYLNHYTKQCPGHFCADTKEDIMDRVHDYIVEHFPAETKAT